ncbi:hypothetical protein IFM89_016591 [Coptis chinensis]|uniref:Uncharacterized protein n=1 Tax=Coptis chinensis TaxID=261450 RepID=A0A835IX07_9MAGN|nr:hypothetical protein IFM89_016591 [Coptis chinensis]
MLRGISGGQMKRVTIGEMLAGAAKALFMSEISIGDLKERSKQIRCVKDDKSKSHHATLTMKKFGVNKKEGTLKSLHRKENIEDEEEQFCVHLQIDITYHNGIQHIDTLTVVRNVL